MDKTLALRSRLNSSFGILSLFSIVMFFVTIFSLIIFFIAQGLIESFSLGEYAYSKAFFYFSFILPQFLYPVLTAIVGCLIPIIGKFKFRDCVKREKVPAVYFILCVFIFPGLSTIFSYISYAISYCLSLIGIPVMDVNSAIPVPDGIIETLLLVFVMAVLPAICEELIYRGFLMSGISEYGQTGAIVVSSIAFGLMHATIQQIPFAFAIGLFLGYVFSRFRSIVLPIVLHFINNFTACVLMILQSYLHSDIVNAISVCVDIFFVAVSLLSFAIFIILSIHDKKAKDLEEQTVNVSDSDGYELTDPEPKANFLQAVTHSWGFWLFVVIYLFTTVSNVIVTSIPV